MDATFFAPRKNDGKIVAFADVGVSVGVVVKGFRIVRSVQGLRAAVPSKSFTVEGRTRWAPLVVFSSPEIRQQFLAVLLEDYRRWERQQEQERERERDPERDPANGGGLTSASG
jgi:DNA-binding cell septation regulator SpoVG